MERKKRPVGREEHVSDGHGSVHKRGDGLNMGGPVGNKDGYSVQEVLVYQNLIVCFRHTVRDWVVSGALM